MRHLTVQENLDLVRFRRGRMSKSEKATLRLARAMLLPPRHNALLSPKLMELPVIPSLRMFSGLPDAVRFSFDDLFTDRWSVSMLWFSQEQNIDELPDHIETPGGCTTCGAAFVAITGCRAVLRGLDIEHSHGAVALTGTVTPHAYCLVCMDNHDTWTDR